MILNTVTTKITHNISRKLKKKLSHNLNKFNIKIIILLYITNFLVFRLLIYISTSIDEKQILLYNLQPLICKLYNIYVDINRK